MESLDKELELKEMKVEDKSEVDAMNNVIDWEGNPEKGGDAVVLDNVLAWRLRVVNEYAYHCGGTWYLNQWLPVAEMESGGDNLENDSLGGIGGGCDQQDHCEQTS